ncbi:selenocysteine-specific translation elongation factor [candidate division WOR-3 bacterium]|nr:selenocysteine-specific translation elongation factor [candidate division WOR-3 bacterium]
MSRKHIVIGTAGHIDHGKSALIKALTGEDPDRLKEEKERGMTTDLGFVFYGDDVTIIDVPGHEKFVRHMVAGASTLDLVIFVIAADDGVMPQTTEHLEILKLLEIKKGFVAITKKDLVGNELLEIVIDDVKNLVKGTFLERAPIVPVSNTTKEGFDTLKQVLDAQLAEIEEKVDKGIFKLSIDRCFSMKGFGTVVAGTVLSGSLKIGDTVDLIPQGKQVKVRGIQVHNHNVPEVTTGFRAAINIVGAETHEIERGDVLGQKGYFQPSEYLNASLYLLASAPKHLKNLVRLRIHLGTKELFSRVVLLDKRVLNPGEKAMVQFRMEKPAVCDVGDRYVVRTWSPQITIGGGVIIEPKAQKATGFDESLIEHLQTIEQGDPSILVKEEIASNHQLPQKIEEIAHDLNLPVTQVTDIVKKLIDEEAVICLDAKRGVYYSQDNIDTLRTRILAVLKDYHASNPTNLGMPHLELHKALGAGLDKIVLHHMLETMAENQLVKTAENKVSLFEFSVTLDKEMNAVSKKIESVYRDAGFKTPGLQELMTVNMGSPDAVKKAFRYLVDSKRLIDAGEGVVFHKSLVQQAQDRVVNFLKQKKEIKVSEFRDMIGASRKYALPLLIYFDTHGITIKRGEVRVLGQKYRTE